MDLKLALQGLAGWRIAFDAVEKLLDLGDHQLREGLVGLKGIALGPLVQAGRHDHRQFLDSRILDRRGAGRTQNQ